MKCEIFSYFNVVSPVFSSYSKSSQEKIVDEVFKRSQKLNTEQTHSLIKKVILSPPGKKIEGSMKHPIGEAFNAFLSAQSDWYKKIPSRKDGLSFLSSVLWKADPAVFSGTKNWLQFKVSNAPQEVLDKKMRSIYVRNLLAYYPFFSPEKTDELRLPFAPLGSSLTYRVEPIELTKPFLGSPLMAYGLTPKLDKAPPVLLFKGTTYPTDKGFFLSILTDLNPIGAVGSFAFQLSAKEKIKSWLDSCPQKVEVIGASLGGALSLQTAVEFPEKIKAVYAFNSPALTPSDVATWQKSKGDKPEVNVYLQDGDPVSSCVGRCFAPDWKVHSVFAPDVSSPQVHSSIYTAKAEAFIIPEDTQSVNKWFARRLWPLIQHAVALPFFMIGSIYLALRVIAFKVDEFIQSFFSKVIIKKEYSELNLSKHYMYLN